MIPRNASGAETLHANNFPKRTVCMTAMPLMHRHKNLKPEKPVSCIAWANENSP